MNRHAIAVGTAVLLATLSAPLAAQDHRAWLALGPGTLNPDDPFKTTLSLRGSAGWIIGDRDAIGFEYTRQSANGSEGDDIGKFARQFIGISWQHAFRPAFFDEESLKQQYLIRFGGGVLTRGRFEGVTPARALKKAVYVDAGVSIRYPFSTHLAAVGTIEDAVAFLPQQTVTSGSTAYDFGGSVQNNFGLFVLLQWRP